ncbi:MAG: 4Fe-4S ferredoxin, partial [Candidatus Methanomethylophilaceae archaeon]|nr:4Fe-4S ferredoxin [Candidatus Methanomethylophilaceae archaeon]
RVTVVGCPKLDSADYSEKLSEILSSNDIRSVTLVRMEVPCCGGMVRAVKEAIGTSGKNVPLKVYTVSREGKILSVE